ncbi:hypothetical protein NKR23_g8037 [Pleurostoma richardsiae]|uniref:Diphthamide biosynthesis protein 4 n=1 Tax=Pleurostoma richardsiae TaxID=41990 RepID=A0AA38R8Y6_9PEZI|nr:hypothetical protein NKR23_g8037 [Pleurostoma richardsiae]
MASLPEEGDALEPTHYEVLGIPRSYLEDDRDPSQIIKTAYHRALLRNHPDKAFRMRPGDPPVTSTGAHSTVFSVDQISAAYAALSDPARRAEYDRALRLARGLEGRARQQRFQTGIESADLDDLAFDEARRRWYRPCRCGNERGFAFGEPDLEEAGDLGELIVGCQDCSLWLRVHFAVVDEANLSAARQPG